MQIEEVKIEGATYFLKLPTPNSTLYSAFLYKDEAKYFVETERFRERSEVFSYIQDKKDSAGLLSPNGKFYECYHCLHLDLIDYLFPYLAGDRWADDKVLKMGWIHYSRCGLGWQISDPQRITQKQINFIDEWMITNKITEFPEWWHKI